MGKWEGGIHKSNGVDAVLSPPQLSLFHSHMYALSLCFVTGPIALEINFGMGATCLFIKAVLWKVVVNIF
jgi:hypothetical protein